MRVVGSVCHLHCCDVHVCVRCAVRAVGRLASLLCVLLCGWCVMRLSLFCVCLICVVLLGFSVECAVSRCSYVVVNDLWCLFCDSVWLPFCYAVCAARVFLCVSGCVGCDLWLLFILGVLCAVRVVCVEYVLGVVWVLYCLLRSLLCNFLRGACNV